jgi:tetratricopeptide (TPR) repeat protein
LERKPSIFISYSRKDGDFVDRLEAGLIARGFKPFLDRSEVLAFEEWWNRIQNLIIKADTIVFVLSPDSVRSTVCAEEVSFAASLKKRFAPIVCRRVEIDAVPDALRRLNFVVFKDGNDFDSTVDGLAKSLTDDIEWIREHTWLTEVAFRWDSSGRPNTMLLRSQELLTAERWLAARPSSGLDPNDLQLALISSSRNQSLQRIQSLDYAARSSNRMVSEVIERLRGQRGVSQALIARILEDAQGLVSGLDADEAPNIRRARAVGLVELSSTLLAQKDAKGALAAAEKAIQIFEESLQSLPEDPDCSSDLLVALDRAGDALFELLRDDEALIAYERSLALARSVVALRGNDAASNHHLSVALEKVADIIKDRDHLAKALSLYHESLALRKELAQHVTTEESYRDVAISVGRIAEMLSALNRPKEAIANYEEGLEILRNATRLHPENVNWQRDSSLIHERIGNIYSERGEWDPALAHYESALALTKQLVASDATNMSFIADIYRHYDHVGVALLQLDQPGNALDTFRSALALAKEQCTNKGNEASWQAASAFYQRSGSIMIGLRGKADSLALAEESAAFLDSDRNSQRVSQVAQALGNVAWYALLGGRFELALIAAQRAHTLVSDNLSLRVNLLYSLVLSDRMEDAEALYARGKNDRIIGPEWTKMLKNDLQELQNHGVAIEKLRPFVNRDH